MNTAPNSANRNQVRKNRKDDDLRRLQELADLRFLLRSQQGRRTFSRLIDYFRPLQNVWNPAAATMGLNAAFHDAGLYLMAEINEADPDALILMQNEEHLAKKHRDMAAGTIPKSRETEDDEQP